MTRPVAGIVLFIVLITMLSAMILIKNAQAAPPASNNSTQVCGSKSFQLLVNGNVQKDIHICKP